MTIASRARIGLLSVLLTSALIALAVVASHARADNVPGTAFPTPGPTTGSLDAKGSNTDAVYSVSLTAGTTYKFSLVQPRFSQQGSDPANFGLYLFAPGTADVRNATAVASKAISTGEGLLLVHYFEYTPTASGTYFLDARADSGNGGYQLYFGEVDKATATCPGTKIEFGKTYSATLSPGSPNLCFSASITSKKEQSFFVKGLKFNGTASDSDSIALSVKDANDKQRCFFDIGSGRGYYATCSPFYADGADTFKPTSSGLYTFAVSGFGPLTADFQFGLSAKVGTTLTLKAKVSSKKRKGKYGVSATSRLTPKKTGSKISFLFNKCDARGENCKLAKTATSRVNRRGSASATQALTPGRYQAIANFKGAAKRFGSTSKPICLPVGPDATCAT